MFIDYRDSFTARLIIYVQSCILNTCFGDSMSFNELCKKPTTFVGWIIFNVCTFGAVLIITTIITMFITLNPLANRMIVVLADLFYIYYSANFYNAMYERGDKRRYALLIWVLFSVFSTVEHMI